MGKSAAQIRHEAIESIVSLGKLRSLRIDPKTYKNSKTKFPFRCLVCGYDGETSLGLLKMSNHGCKKCGSKAGASKQRLGSEVIVEEARMAGIQITLGEYQNTNQKVECRCSNCAHQWTTTIGCIRSGRGCPKCKRKQASAKTSLQESDVRNRIQQLGITLLSAYVNSRSKIKVRFNGCGHSIMTTWNQIQVGGGCGECAPNKKIELSKYEETAQKFDGRLLEMPTTVEQKAHWQCREGHRFHRSIRHILRLNTFCTKCNDGWGESLCRMVLEKAFKKPFNKIRPKDLLSPKGVPIELDCYNSDLAIALEHQGMHHFKRQTNWQSVEQFKLCQQHDRIKKKYCENNGILLIVIKEVGSLTDQSLLVDTIAQQIENAGRTVPSNLRKLDITAHKVVSRRSQFINDVYKTAKRLGLELLETPKLAEQKILVRCKNGHETLKTSRLIIGGRGCSSCYLSRKSVRLSDGRIFNSGADAAQALGVERTVVNAAIRRGGKVKGYCVVRL